MDWEIAGLLKASQHRQQILKALKQSPATPNDIAKNLDIHLSQVTRSLREMEKFGLVECKTPDLKKGRIYAITKKGEDILKKMRLG